MYLTTGAIEEVRSSDGPRSTTKGSWHLHPIWDVHSGLSHPWPEAYMAGCGVGVHHQIVRVLVSMDNPRTDQPAIAAPSLAPVRGTAEVWSSL